MNPGKKKERGGKRKRKEPAFNFLLLSTEGRKRGKETCRQAFYIFPLGIKKEKLQSPEKKE